MTERLFARPQMLSLLLGTLLIAACNQAAAPATALQTQAVGDKAQVWLTTPDRSNLLAQQADLTFSAVSSADAAIKVDASQTFQTMDGFGASITDSSAALLYQLPVSQRDQVMRSIFSPTQGVGMSFLRQPLGSSDFVNGPHYSFNDIPADQTDYTMSRFSIDHDQAQILPLLRQAIALNPQLKVMATPWGQPAWMKEGGRLFGGKLKNDPAVIDAYALYLLKSVQAYEAAGVPIYGLTMQNEPQNVNPDAYPGTDMPVATEAAVINALGPKLRDAGLSRVKIIGFDHNWKLFPGDPSTEPNYPYDLLRTSASQWIAGTGYHCYAGDATAQTALHNTFPTKDIWFTECSGFRGTNDSQAKAFADTLNYHAKNITIASARNYAKAVVNWNLVLDNNGKPNNGGCGKSPNGVCTGAVAINGTAVQYNAEYYNLGHMSKFVKSGAVRIASTIVGNVENVAFKNPDGTIALVLHNSNGGQQSVNVAYGNAFLSYTLPAGGLATITWAAGSTTPPPVDTTPPSTPGNLTASNITQASATLNWSASTDASGIAGYDVYRGGTKVGSTAANTTSYTDAALTAATTYSYAVSARDNATNVSPRSAALSVTTLAVVTPPPAGPIDPARRYQVVNTNSGKCLDDTDRGTGNGTALQQWACSSPVATNQSWQFKPTSDGYYQVVSAQAPIVWDVAGGQGATGNGSNVQLWAYVGGTNQQWKPVDLGGGSYQFVARHSNKCLDVRDVSVNNGARLQQWDCTQGPAQKFTLR
ncbi:RICIN domain-containing protein [Deinococcus sp.]|uniref:RICIN domain-containing protein n=1 Tax=Deinococcus sp. TaxID=47478 RepID=UPI0025EA172C|nr:RICIN domain-containing protein [Deinococcus sp.]